MANVRLSELRVARVESRAADSKQEKLFAVVVSILTIAAVFSPVIQNWRERPADSFPLSYYPMFSEKRDEATRVTYIAGIDADGNRSTIPYTYAGKGGLNQVRRQIGKTLNRGEADKLCEQVAAKVAKRKRGKFAGVSDVEIITGRYNLNNYFSGQKTPVSEKIQARCAVMRGARPVPDEHGAPAETETREAPDEQ